VAAATEETALQLAAAANKPIDLREISVGGLSDDATDEPWIVRLRRQTTAGTGGSSVTPENDDEGITHTFQTTGLKSIQTAAPTASGDPLRVYVCNPRTGLVIRFEPGEIVVDGSGKLGLTLESADANTAVAHMKFGE